MSDRHDGDRRLHGGDEKGRGGVETAIVVLGGVWAMLLFK